MTLVVIIIIALVFVAYRWGKTQEEKQILGLLMALKPFEQEFQSALSDFDSFGKQNWYVSDRQFRLWCEKYQHLVGKFNPVFVEINTTDPLKQLVIDFNDRHTSGRKYIEKLNENFVRKEAPTIDKILSTKEIQHNSDQVTAIASDEDNTLLVAGAGTGKTTTILGKLAYLIERAHVKPDEILLLSFTGRAVDELTERIETKFPDQNIKAQTFHSFGLSIIGSVLKKKPDLAFSTPASRQKFLDEQFDQQLKTPAYLHRAVEYFAYYLKPVILKPGFQTLDDYFMQIRYFGDLNVKLEAD
jgi:DNA helicase-4